MSATISDQVDKTTTPRESLLKDMGPAPIGAMGEQLSGALSGAQRVHIANWKTNGSSDSSNFKIKKKHRRNRVKHPRRHSRIDIDGDGNKDWKIVESQTPEKTKSESKRQV